MPEGDTIFRAARTLDRALGGRVIRGFRSTVPHFAFVDLTGRRIEEVEARGKNILMHLDGGQILHSHMKMRGAWHIYRPGEKWQKPTVEMRLVLETDDYVAVCFSAPVIDLWGREEFEREGPTKTLGPDLLRDEADLEPAARQLSARSDLEVGEAILDQGIVAGIGNIYKSEILFIERVDPFLPASALTPERWRAVLEHARSLMRRNLSGSNHRTRTALSGPKLWVYDRAGEPCLRCGEKIRRTEQGKPSRATYHCPSCQPVR